MSSFFDMMWNSVMEGGRKYTLEGFVMDDRWRTFEEVKIAGSETMARLVMELIRNELLVKKVIPSADEILRFNRMVDELLATVTSKTEDRR